MVKIQKEEYNRLLKVKIFQQGKNQWRLLPVEKRDGSSIRRKDITFRGDDEKLKLLLRRLKAKDAATDPPSAKNRTYQQMINTARDKSDPYIWIWLTIWNNYKDGNKITNYNESIIKNYERTMEFIGLYQGYDNNEGMVFKKFNKGDLFYIRDGEMNLNIGEQYKIIAYDYNLGSYGDAPVINDYDIIGVTIRESNLKKESIFDAPPMYKKGDTVTIPHKGRMVQGKIIRYDQGNKISMELPFYVVDVGEYESIKIGVHKLDRELQKYQENLKERKFDLSAGHLGNGTIIYNKAKEIHGDYEKIAHISDKGKISWHINNPPKEVIDYVNNIAENPDWMYEKYKKYKKETGDTSMIFNRFKNIFNKNILNDKITLKKDLYLPGTTTLIEVGDTIEIIKERVRDYKIYHSSYSGAISEVIDWLQENNLKMHEEDIFTYISSGPKKPSEGKTNKFNIYLYLANELQYTPAMKMVHFQIYGMKTQYELNMYLSPAKNKDYPQGR